MINADGTYGIKYETAIDRHTGEYIVLKKVRGQIQQDAVFYDPEKHTDLTVPCCAVPTLQVIQGYHQAGGKWVSTHFKLAHGEHHPPTCPNQPVKHSEDHTPRDESMGPVIFLNGTLSDFGRDFKESARKANEERLVQRTPEGKYVIANDNLEPRPRENAVKPAEFFAIMKRKGMTQERLNDAKIIFDDEVISWDKFFIRGRRLIELAKELISPDQDSHPVLLHLRVVRDGRRDDKNGNPRLVVKMNNFSIEHPETGRMVRVYPRMYVRDPAHFNEFKGLRPGETREFFVLTPAWISGFVHRSKEGTTRRFISDEEASRSDRAKPRHLFLHFEWKPHLSERKTLAELKAEVQEKPSFAASLSPSDPPAPA